jgi:hypothetical protein
MKTLLIAMAAASAVVVTSALADDVPRMLLAQGTQQDLKGMEKAGQRDDTPQMTAAQATEYRAQYEAAKAQWAKMTPEQQKAAVAAARQKKLQDLSYIELVGQRDDMRAETAAQSGALKAQADAAKTQWDSMTPAQKAAVRKASWAKKREELSGIEAVGQRDDSYVLPW